MQLRKVAAALAAMAAVHAHAGAVAGATEPTQIMNNVELIMSTAQQAQMIANQLQDLKTLATSDWGNAQQDLMKLATVVSTANGISYNMENIDAAFSQKFPGYQQWRGDVSFGQLQRDWSKSTMDTVKSALQAAGLQSQQFATERLAISAIQAMSSGSVGSVQAIQAGTQIASATVDQLQKLRQLTMLQIQSQSGYIATQEQKGQTKRAATDSLIKVYTPGSSGFSSKGGKN
ncbi:P-type conjugative transfer protein TrbJ [Cupriavidus pauculus]|uniref:P-type conjugative transfer protein TrbJ n=1 Tax=Cupriavidus pauculus TaxID=82633 RepID=UPI0038577318